MQVQDIETAENELVAALQDGRTVITPLAWRGIPAWILVQKVKEITGG